MSLYLRGDSARTLPKRLSGNIDHRQAWKHIEYIGQKNHFTKNLKEQPFTFAPSTSPPCPPLRTISLAS